MVFKNWIRVLTKPKRVFAEEKANASLKKPIKKLFVATIIIGVFIAIAAYIFSPFFGFYEFSFEKSLLVLVLFIVIVFSVLLVLIMFLIFSGILYVFAKLLRGRGNFTTQTYLIGLFYIPFIVITDVLWIFLLVFVLFFALASGEMIVGVIGYFIVYFLGLIMDIYGLYLLTLALKETHQYSTGKAILTWLIPFIVFVIIGIMIAIIWFMPVNP